MSTIRRIKPIERSRRAGSLSIEMIVAVGIMAVFFTVIGRFGNTFRKVDESRWARHTLNNAGQAQMDAIFVTGKPIDEAVFKRLWPTVECRVEIGEGQGQWQGLLKVQLHLSTESRQQPIETSLTAYVDLSRERPQ